ncbi:TPA: lipopolysaccharide biosynthesis protein, partial [Neisseria gonorrhoeae]
MPPFCYIITPIKNGPFRPPPARKSATRTAAPRRQPRRPESRQIPIKKGFRQHRQHHAAARTSKMDTKEILGYAAGSIGSAVLAVIILPLLSWYFPADDIGRIVLMQ